MHQKGIILYYHYYWGFPGGSDGKESTCNAADLGSIPGLGRSPGGGPGNPLLQYSCLENPHGQRSQAGYSPCGRRVGHDWATKHSTPFSLNRCLRPCPHWRFIVAWGKKKPRRLWTQKFYWSLTESLGSERVRGLGEKPSIAGIMGPSKTFPTWLQVSRAEGPYMLLHMGQSRVGSLVASGVLVLCHLVFH